jgi:hypothetical protein
MNAAQQIKTQRSDARLLREIVADNRTNPQRAIPPSPTVWNAHAMAIFDHIQEQKAEERRAAAAERSAMATARTQ